MATKDAVVEEPVQTKKFLSKNEIFGLDDSVIEEVYVEAWKSYVRVKGLTAGQRDKYEAAMLEGKGKNQRVNLANARAKLIQLCVVDEEGKPMFTEHEVGVLAGKSAAALEPLFDAARRISAMTEDDIEELTGNSETDPS